MGFDDAVKVLFYYKSFNRVAARHDRALVQKKNEDSWKLGKLYYFYVHMEKKNKYGKLSAALYPTEKLVWHSSMQTSDLYLKQNEYKGS